VRSDIAAMIVRLPFQKYAKTAEMQATGHLGDGPLVLMDYVLRILRVVILLALWRTVLGGRGEVSGMTLGAVLTYTLIAEVFAHQLEVTSRIEDTMWEGTLAGRFLRPMGLVGQFTAQLIGDWAFTFVTFSIPLLLLAPALGVDPRPASLANGLLFLVSLSLAVTIGLAVDFFFAGLAALINQNIWQVKHVRNALSTVLSGALIPLQLLPWGLGAVFSWLPFASMASAPLRIYTGTGDPLPLMAIQLFWCAVLWPVAVWMWTTHREKLTVFGG
jgi:ABC-2 type transport system permease protein